MGRPAARIVVLALPLVLGTWCPGAVGCPFCNVVGESLAMRRDAATLVAVGEAREGVKPGTDRFPSQSFTLGQVVRGTLPPENREVTATVPGPVEGTALVFGVMANGGLRWSAVAANEAVLGYASAAPATSLPIAERLRWFAKRLEHQDPVIAADAFTEFGLAPLEAVRQAADAFDPATLAAWVDEPGIDSRRRGFYGLAAGIVAAQSQDARVRHDLLAALRAAIVAPADDFRMGFDGLLGGLLVAEGSPSLDEFERCGLFAPTARAVDQRHLLAALRFAWESLGDTIPRDRIAAATARLLDSPVVAADASIDLARYGMWDSIEKVAGLWETLGRDDPLVRRAVAGYLDACPLPAARIHLDRLQAADPKRLAAALEAARAPFGR